MKNHPKTIFPYLVRATLYGQAIGDALGIPVEFKAAKDIPGLRATWNDEWPHAFRPTNRRGGTEVWGVGEWSDDTDQALVLLDSYLEGLYHGQHISDPIPLTVVARRLTEWAQSNGRGMGNHTRKVLEHPVFLTDPCAAATEVWEQSERKAAPNGAVMRTAYVGLLNPLDLDWTAREAAACASVTHADPRCLASAVAISVAIASMVTGSSASIAIGHASRYASKHDPEVVRWMHIPELAELKLDEGLGEGGPLRAAPVGFTYKCMGAGFWALRQAEYLGTLNRAKQTRFEEPLHAVLLSGGDADTNGAVAGALLGALLGMRAIPVLLREGLRPQEVLDQAGLNVYPRGQHGTP